MRLGLLVTAMGVFAVGASRAASEGAECVVACDPGKTLESEPICSDFDVSCDTSANCPNGEACVDGHCEFEDLFNGGCDAPSPVFTPIVCGQEYCGTAGTFCGSNCSCLPPEDVNGDGQIGLLDIICILDGIAGEFDTCVFADVDVAPCGGDGRINLFDALAVLKAFAGAPGCCGSIALRDTDWYELVLAQDTFVTLSGAAEFEATYRIIKVAAPQIFGPCAVIDVVAEVVADPCEPVSLSKCLAPGTYYFVVAPVRLTQIPCDSQYTLRVDCESCALLCGAGDGDCCEAAGNGTARCEDAACCGLVCDIDPSCCSESGVWNEACAALAADLCELCPSAADDCADAGLLPVPSMVEDTTVGSTPDDAPTCSNITNTSPGVWYAVTGTGNTMTATMCNEANFDTKLTVYCAGCEELNCVTANDDRLGCSFFRSRVDWCSAVGQQYLILVHGYVAETGDFVLEVFDDSVPCTDHPDCGVAVCGDGIVGGREQCDDGNLEPGDGCDENCMIEPPMNDNCADAIAVTESETPLAFDSTAATTDGPSHPSCLFFSNNQVNNDIWYDHTAECTGTLTIDTCGTTFDTKLTVYDGCGCPVDDDIKLGCDDDTCDLQSQVIIEAVEGSCYKIRVGSFGGLPSDTGPGTLTIFCDNTVPEGACCLDEVCIATTTNESCVSAGGVWTFGENCPDFFCLLPNDECEGRTPVPCNGSVVADTTNATNSDGDPEGTCWFGDGAGTVFLEFVATAESARIRTDVDVVLPADDSEFAVYEVNQADPCDKTAWVEIGCSEDEGIAFNGDICVGGLAVGNIYIIELSSFTAGSRGRYTVGIECPCPPSAGR